MKQFSFLLALILAHFCEAQTIQTIAGNGSSTFSGDSIPANTASLNLPTAICRDDYGNIFIADRYNHRVRKIDYQNGEISTVAGIGTAGFSGDSSAAVFAQLNQPIGVCVAADGTLFIADNGNHRIRKVDASGMISTIAGTGLQAYNGDVIPAVQASLNSPWGVCLTGNQSLLIADRANDRIRMVDANGIIYTVAGNGSTGYSGNNGPAVSAALNRPIAVCVDTAGNIYFADENNNRVRKVLASDSTIVLVAGNGTAGYNGNGMPAVNAELNKPCGVAVDYAGNIYISDRMNQRLRKVATNGTISTIAGNGNVGFSGDGGNATSANINYPRELFSDGSGNIYFADTDNNRIRKISYCNLPDIPTIAASTTQICTGDSAVLTVGTGNLNDAQSWSWYSGSCGGTQIGTGDTLLVYPTTSTSYFVRGEGGCTTPYACGSVWVDVSSVPEQPQTIVGDSIVCNGSEVVYYVDPVAGAGQYNWSLPSGWSGVSSSTSISTVAGSNSGLISVYADNGCGNGPAQTFATSVTVVDVTVSQSFDSLIAEAVGPATYQWFNCDLGLPVAGATNPFFQATMNGNYALIITQNGCVDTSACFVLVPVSISSANTEVLDVMPNPTSNCIHIKIPASGSTVGHISLLGTDGRQQKQIIPGNPGDRNFVLSTEDLPTGVYIIRVNTGNRIFTTRFVKE